MPTRTVACEKCGKPASQSFGEGGMGWHESFHCPSCGKSYEADGRLPAPEEFRRLILAEEGGWGLEVTVRPGLLLLQALRKELSLSLRETQELKARLPGIIRCGTRHEMEQLLQSLESSSDPGTLAVRRTKEMDLTPINDVPLRPPETRGGQVDQPMRHSETMRLLVRRVGAVLEPHGFSRRDLAWYRHDRQFTTALFLTLGSRRIAARIAVFDRREHRETHPPMESAAKVVGLSWIVPDESTWRRVRTFIDWRSEEDVEPFVGMIRGYALPELDHWQGVT